MIDVLQFRDLIIRPTLVSVNMWSMSAESLLLGTALAESKLTYLKQLPDGPALGFFQMEKATYQDLLRYLNMDEPDNKATKERFLNSLLMPYFPSFESLAFNLRLQVLFARLRYWIEPERLPKYNDLEGLGSYWKRHYNTSKGKGEVSDFVIIYKEVIG